MCAIAQIQPSKQASLRNRLDFANLAGGSVQNMFSNSKVTQPTFIGSWRHLGVIKGCKSVARELKQLLFAQLRCGTRLMFQGWSPHTVGGHAVI